MSDERETRLIVISPDSNITPDQISRSVHAMGFDVTVKETCYGSVIEGRRDEVRKALERVREIEPNAIFSKVRAFPVGDPRRCRAQHGSRPGFAQLEQEWQDLGKIQHALECADRGETVDPESPKAEKLNVKEFKKICEVTE